MKNKTSVIKGRLKSFQDLLYENYETRSKPDKEELYIRLPKDLNKGFVRGLFYKAELEVLPGCKVCGAPYLDDQVGQANPLCPKHEEEQRQREEFMSAGRGDDPETAREE